MDKKWKKIVDELDFAFQPIVHILSGEIFAVEALLRNYEKAGFNSIFELFDIAFYEGILYKLDLELRKKALLKLKELDINPILFYNLDNRIIKSPDLSPGNTQELLKALKLSSDRICFELSERVNIEETTSLTYLVERYKLEGFKLAIDDFGTGIAGLKMLYHTDVDYLKIDRFFIDGIDKSHKKQIFIKHVTNLAHILGIKVIAEGIEKKEEFLACKNLNVDYVQGFLIQKPTTNTKKILKNYEIVVEINKQDKRKKIAISDDLIEYIPPVNENAPLSEVLDIFKQNINLDFIPVVDDENNFKGVIKEKDITKLLLSPYGYSIAQNKNRNIKNYIQKFLSIEQNIPIEDFLEIYTTSEENKKLGVIITNNGKYKGFINNMKIIELAYKKNLEYAQDLNPLTKLPGNRKIEEFIQNALNSNEICHIVYFDLDNFKPFNDKYGFRKGDRILTLFADILKKELSNDFIAHIGGDDFFAGFKNKNCEYVYKKIKKIKSTFEKDVIDFYDEKDKKRGYIVAKDRFGIKRQFPFLTASSIIIEIHDINKETLDLVLQDSKKEAKKVNYPVCITPLPMQKFQTS